jgi:hypothetical protein
MKYALLALLLLLQTAQAQEITVVSDTGNAIALDVNSHLPLQHILDEASMYLADAGDNYNVYITNVSRQSYVQSASIRRDYNSPANPQQVKDITYIVTTLGSAPLKSLYKNEGNLKKVGDRIDMVHPLRFLEVLFSSEELKASAHAVRQRTFFVWGNFFDGLKESLDEEYVNGNLTDAQIADFSSRVGIDPNVIMGPIHNRNWQQFYDTLLREIPRKGNPGKYNM